MSTGCGVFAILGREFDQCFFFADRFLERKDTKEYKFGTIKAFERVKYSLPVDMHYSKTSLLKLPYNETRTKPTTSK